MNSPPAESGPSQLGQLYQRALDAGNAFLQRKPEEALYTYYEALNQYRQLIYYIEH